MILYAVTLRITRLSGHSIEAFDVAIIFLKEDAVLSKNVQLALLPEANEACPTGNNLILSGWGLDPYKGVHHHILWAVKQACLDVTKCDRFDSLEDKGLILCVGDKKDPRNSGFHGDSGGKIFFSNMEDFWGPKKNI